MRENYWTRRAHRGMNRRRFLMTTGAAGAGLGAMALVGCGGDDDNGSSGDDFEGAGVRGTPQPTRGSRSAVAASTTPTPPTPTTSTPRSKRRGS